MSDGGRGHGILSCMRPRPGQAAAVEAHVAAWYRGPGRELPGTRLHLLLDETGHPGEILALHLFESAAAWQRTRASTGHREWLTALADLLEEPPEQTEVAVRWNAATGARPRVSVSIDRDVHAAVQDLIGRLIDRHPRTPAEDAYLSMLQSVADDYERDFPAVMPEEEAPR